MFSKSFSSLSTLSVYRSDVSVLFTVRIISLDVRPGILYACPEGRYFVSGTRAALNPILSRSFSSKSLYAKSGEQNTVALMISLA